MPEYASHRDTLAQLQGRFEAALSPQVTTAFAAHDTDRCTELLAIFRRTDRMNDVRKLYLRALRPPFARAWADALAPGHAATTTAPAAPAIATAGAGARTLGRLAEALAVFYDTVLALVGREQAWLHVAVPGAVGWVPALVADALAALEPPLAAKITAAVNETNRHDEELVRLVSACRLAGVRCAHGGRSA